MTIVDTWRAWLYPLGFLSTIAFGLRFLIQWWESEKEKRSIVPPAFWKWSLIGNFLLFVHCTIQLQFPIALIQAIQMVLSWRNLNLLQPKQQQIQFRSVIVLFFVAIFTTIALFVLQSIFLEGGHVAWIHSPYSMGQHVAPREVPLAVHIMGIIGFSAFSVRFWIQWWQAEHGEKSELAPSFWWMSLFGSVTSSLYFLIIYDWVNLIGPFLSLFVYGRNLVLIRQNKNVHVHKQQPSIFVFAGELSGDLYGAQIIHELKKHLPHVAFFGVGGPKMRGTSIEMLYPMERFQVMGFSDVIKALPRLIVSILHLKKKILERQPLLCLFIDQPDFAMRLAKRLRKAHYEGKIVQFVAPTVWAYKGNRAQKMAEDFDLLLTLFSFEPPYFAHTKLKTVWTGHPLVESIPQEVHKPQQLLSIFPGSRPAEIERNLPIQLEAACLFCKRMPDFDIAISCASHTFHNHPLIEAICKKTGYTKLIALVPFEERYTLMQRSQLALAKSGTVTLELALHCVPTVVTYQLSKLNRFIATYFLKLTLPFFCIVNIVKGKEVFPELIKDKVVAQDVANKLLAWYSDKTALEQCRQDCKEIFLLIEREKKPTQVATEAILAML